MENSKSLFIKGAENGVMMGVIFIVQFLLWTLSANFLVSILYNACFVIVAMYAYRKLRDSYFDTDCTATYPNIWLEGIFMFIGATLFLGAAAFVFFRWISPDFIPNLMSETLKLYEETPALKPFAPMAREALEKSSMLRPVNITLIFVWMSIVSGIIASAIIAAVVKSRRKPTSPSNQA